MEKKGTIIDLSFVVLIDIQFRGTSQKALVRCLPFVS